VVAALKPPPIVVTAFEPGVIEGLRPLRAQVRPRGRAQTKRRSSEAMPGIALGSAISLLVAPPPVAAEVLCASPPDIRVARARRDSVRAGGGEQGAGTAVKESVVIRVIVRRRCTSCFPDPAGNCMKLRVCGRRRAMRLCPPFDDPLG
jgi:hypothetical protein